ncbi:hypothetical protein [Chryseobacterium sp. Bi04]|uniref:hypothetical protein n=1 Tax=Chryseobacterium sp. Bi04 TaxID=2822345 RepID=UPI001DBAA60D|nr:hypothetical protein SRABI04_01724 [Chryseobacterium sp. Bi04]
MSRNYKFHNPEGLYFISFAVVGWHVHLVFRSINGQKPETLIGDLKRFTSKAIVRQSRKILQKAEKNFY